MERVRSGLALVAARENDEPGVIGAERLMTEAQARDSAWSEALAEHVAGRVAISVIRRPPRATARARGFRCRPRRRSPRCARRREAPAAAPPAVCHRTARSRPGTTAPATLPRATGCARSRAPEAAGRR